MADNLRSRESSRQEISTRGSGVSIGGKKNGDRLDVGYDMRQHISNAQPHISRLTAKIQYQACLYPWTASGDLREEFMTAAEQGDAEKVRRLLERQKIAPDVSGTREGFGCSALSIAATYGQTFVLAELLKGGADPALKSASQRTPLHEACIGGHYDCACLLVDVMQDLNIADKNGQTAAHLAAFNGETQCLKLLAEKGANLVAEDHKGRQSAHLAATRNHVGILQLLFDKGVDLDCQCETGKTPLHYAAQYGGLESVVCLVERDCDTTVGDTNTYLAAHLAARYNKRECLKFLVKQGTAMDAVQGEGRACSHVAALHGSADVLHWLLENGADVNLQDHYGNSPTHYAAEGGKAECYNCCLQHDADLTITNIKGDTSQATAKKNGHPLVMEKAVANEVTCPLCFKKFEKEEYDRAHAPAPVERSITYASSIAYSSPLPALERKPTQLQKNARYNKTDQKNLFKTDLKKKVPKKQLPNRDLPTKYFGEYLDPNEVFKFKQ